MTEADDGLHFLPFFLKEPIYSIKEPSFSPGQAETKPDLSNIPVLGGNKKKVLILVEENHTAFISQTNEQLLQNILNAVALSLEDVALINLKNVPFEPAMLPEILKNIPFQIFISFGAEPDAWPISNFFVKYTVSSDDTRRKFLLADSLNDLRQDPLKKKKLWQSLQELFLG